MKRNLLQIAATAVCISFFNLEIKAQTHAITLDVQSALPDNYFGFNSANLVRPTSPNFDTQWLLDSLEMLSTNIVRYPAGTISNYWDWQRGFFDDDMPNGWVLPKDFKDNEYKDMRMDKLKTMVERLGVTPVLNMNLLTKDKFHAAAGVMFAEGLNLNAKYVEFGNELYNDIPLYEERFETAEAYMNEANSYAQFIKSVPGLSNVKIAVVGATDKYPAEPLESRKNRWTGVAASTANSSIDAITLHHYLATALGSKQLDNNIGLALSNALKGFDDLSDELATIQAAGKECWITEYNLFERKKCANEGFFHGLFTSTMTLSMLQSPVITRVMCHSMVGSAENSALFDDDQGLLLKGAYDNNVSCAPNPLPLTKVHEKTAMGVCMELVGDALKNADVKRKLIFGNVPKIGANAEYDALFGYWFDGKLSTDMVIINLDSNDRTVSIATNVFNVSNGKYIMVSPGPGGVLEPVKGAAKLNPGTYECRTSGIVNATQTLTLKKYSVTRIYVTKSNVKLVGTDLSICSGTTTSVVARGGSGFTYNNGTLVSLKPDNSVMQFTGPVVSTPTNYKIKVTTAQGYTDSVTITVNPKPVLTVSASATTVCKGAPVNLTATLTGGNAGNAKSFLWYPSQYFVKADTAKAVAMPTKNITFKCFATDGVCFALSDSVPPVEVIPNANAGADIAVCDDSLPVLLKANFINGGSSYKWYDNNGVLLNNGNQVSVSPLEATTYRLVVTQGANSCKDTDYVQVKPFTCCASAESPSILTVRPGEKWVENVVPRLIAYCIANPGHGYCTEDTLMNFSDEILFNGDFFMDDDFTFINCPNLRFAESARFNFVEGVAKLKMVDCTLEASGCSNRMWNGFNMIDFGASLTLENCKVSDCEIIVDGYVDPGLYLSNNRFDRFYKGIYLTESSYEQQGWFYGNTFTQSATLKYPHSGKKSLYAIKLDNYQSSVIGDTLFGKNSFSNLQYGIISINSNFNLYNCKFDNITAWDSNDSTNGSAVLLVNSFGFGDPNNPTHLYPELFFKSGADFNAKPNKFENCTYGIYAINSRVEIKSNVFKNTNSAIELVGLTKKTTYINKNTISSSNVGIDIVHPKLCTVHINNNVVSTNVQSTGNVATPAIRVLDAPGQACTLFMKSNLVNSGGTHGYHFANGKSAFGFSDNKIYFTNPNATFTSYGYRFENMDSITFKCNLARGSDTHAFNKKIGASFSFCPNASVQCNTFNQSDYGLEFLGDCNNMELKNNEFQNLNDGLVIGAVGQTGGVIGPQPASTNGAPGRNLFLGAYVSDNNGPNKNKGVFGHAATWVINSQCAGTKGSSKQFFAQWNDSITVPYPNLKTGAGATAITPYYQTKAGKSCNVNCIVQNPQNRMANITDESYENDTDTGIKIDFEYTINEALPTSDEATAYSIKTNLLKAFDNNKVTDDDALVSFYNEYSNSNLAAFNKIEKQIELLQSKLMSTEAYNASVTNLENLNAAIIPQTIIEAQCKTINSLNFKLLSGGNLNTQEIALLNKLAYQCPYIYGNNVFKARSINALYNRNANYDDAQLCRGKYQITELNINEIGADGLYVGLYPNPNNGSFQLKYDLSKLANAQIKFYDLMGKVITTEIVNTTATAQNFSLQNLSNGIYYYAIYSHDQMVHRGKFSIVNN